MGKSTLRSGRQSMCLVSEGQCSSLQLNAIKNIQHYIRRWNLPWSEAEVCHHLEPNGTDASTIQHSSVNYPSLLNCWIFRSPCWHLPTFEGSRFPSQSSNL